MTDENAHLDQSEDEEEQEKAKAAEQEKALESFFAEEGTDKKRAEEEKAEKESAAAKIFEREEGEKKEETTEDATPEALRQEPEVREVTVEQRVPEAETEAEQEAKRDKEIDELISLPPEPDDGIKRRWYALHAYSGQEASVKRTLQAKAEQLNLDHLFGGILVPIEEVAEIKGGEKKVSKRKYFPGYVLIKLPEHPEKNADLWHLIKETPGVSGFIGGTRNQPTPLADSEVQAIIEEVRGERERPKPKVAFEVGERVKIIDGPFANFMGNIDEIDTNREKLRVMVEIFERLTSVEVEYWQVEKM